MIQKLFFFTFAFLFSTQAVFADIKTQVVDYSDGGVPLQGYVAFDDSNPSPKPGILIVHDWMGLGPFTKEKANELAKQGYVAMAVDAYGKGVHPKDTKEAGQLATKFKNDRNLFRSRLRAAFDKLASMKEVDSKKIVVMGYCFGGTAALELARSGAPLAGAVSFHGNLSTPTPADAKNIKAPILVLHGADDPHVPPAEVEAFKKEMKDAGVDMKFVAYPDAVHAFTNPVVGNDKSKGIAYNAEADRKSWREFQKFLARVS